MDIDISKQARASFQMDNDSPLSKENISPNTEIIHKKPLQRKIPPHMRRLNMRFSSPSDNLSPMSQKLMLADRNNTALKAIRPKSLKNVLLNSTKTNIDSRIIGTDCADLSEDSEINLRNDELNAEFDLELDDNEMEDVPPSPTKSLNRSLNFVNMQ